MTDVSTGDIQETVGAFQTALKSKKMEVPDVQPRRLLLALDGSNQDATAQSLAVQIAKRTEASIHMTFAYQGPDDPEKDRYLQERADAVAEQGIKVTHGRKGHGRPFRQITDLSYEQKADLIVVAAPYMEDFEELGEASIGTNLDMLMSVRPAPLLVVRSPDEESARCLHELVVPLNFLENGDTRSLGWALRLIDESGTLHLLAVVDTEVLEAVESLVGESVDVRDLDESMLAGLGRPEIAGMISSMQRRSYEMSIGCRVSVRVGAVTPATAEYVNQQRCAVIISCPEHCTATGYQRVQALIRVSRHPVLVV